MVYNSRNSSAQGSQALNYMSEIFFDSCNRIINYNLKVMKALTTIIS